MEIENLTKMQIVLLTLLVSFVTSIATGIVTVTLMDQAPPAVTQTLNRVVERTVERVVPDDSKQGASVITKETTVVVKEEDLITDSINNNSKSVVRIYEALEDGTTGVLKGLGVLVSRDGIIATDPSVIESGLTYIIETANKEVFSSNVVETGESEPAMFLLVEIPEGDETVFPAVELAKHISFKLGQTILSLTGEERTDVAIGIIAGLIEEDVIVEVPVSAEEGATDIEEEGEEAQPETIKVLSLIKTSIDEKEVIAGSPLIDIFGEVIGISTGNGTEKTAMFTPVNGMRSAISQIIKIEESTPEETEE
jgi:S1-C subfamily serine protease